MAQAAASGHKLIEGIVVEGVSFEAPLGPVTQCVQFGEVHTEISHMQELWRQIVRPQMAGVEGKKWGCLSTFIAATSSSTPAVGPSHPCSSGYTISG